LALQAEKHCVTEVGFQTLRSEASGSVLLETNLCVPTGPATTVPRPLLSDVVKEHACQSGECHKDRLAILEPEHERQRSKRDQRSLPVDDHVP
jgi:hypothetical protein